jgi:dTDP-4-dehydrorhamnose reductase
MILGPTGQVGTAFARIVDHPIPVPRRLLDLASLDADAASSLLDEHRPDVVVNCAAYTAVDRAETEEQVATEINGHAVGRLATACAIRDLPFVSYSSDYVFDGTGLRPYVESDSTDPINAYGRSKLVGERAMLQAGGRGLMVRTSWVVSGTHPNFVATMLRLARDGVALRVVSDQRGCPTVAADLAAGTIEAVEAGVTGLLHLTNSGDTTWFDLARSAIGLAGMDPDSVSACATEEYPTPARRPRYSVLGSERRGAIGLSPLPCWDDSLPGVVKGLLESVISQ